MAIQAAEEEEEGTELVTEPEVVKKSVKKAKLEKKNKVEWVGEGVKEGRKKFYTTASIKGKEVSCTYGQ